MSIENKKISEDELDNVTGGCGDHKTMDLPGNIRNYLGYSVPVDKYSGQIGTKYLFKKDSGNWIFGELINSYEEQNVFNTIRMHDIKVEDAAGFAQDDDGRTFVSDWGTLEVNGNEYVMYAKG